MGNGVTIELDPCFPEQGGGLTMFLLLAELSYAWIFNEYPSYQDNRRFVSQETGNLYIAKVEKSDVGNYTCVVTNTVTNHKVLGPPTPLILRNDGEFSKGFCEFCALGAQVECGVL